MTSRPGRTARRGFHRASAGPASPTGRLAQAAKRQTLHVEEMLARNRVRDDGETQELLQSLQDDLNTEPDLVLQWADRLLLVEIKVLSGRGATRPVDNADLARSWVRSSVGHARCA